VTGWKVSHSVIEITTGEFAVSSIPPKSDAQIVDEYEQHAYPKDADSLLPADVVMKGGITSGVVYPLAVCELAKTYRFCNVGGSSAGGIAAAFAAAAERNRGGRGFNELAAVPADLGRQLPHLFQPSHRTRALFRVFRAATSETWRLPRIIWAAVSAQRPATLAGAAFGASGAVLSLILTRGAPHSGEQWLRLLLDAWPAIPAVVLMALVGAALGTVVAAVRALPLNGHGLCIGSNGKMKPGKGPLPFTDWMDDRLSRIGGHAGVLTFGDLWGDAARTAYFDAGSATKEKREKAMRAAAAKADVRLEMMTTNVTHAKPVRLPFVEDVYFFCETELSRWFPPRVMEVLLSKGAEASKGGVPWLCPEHGTPLRKLPEPPDFPVVVAVRMTLSFPGLISTVPLWSVDYGALEPAPVRCRFSDGGVSSNFPIHFFDALVPGRPTFAIGLGSYPKGRESDHVRYPASKTGLPSVRETDSLRQFVGALLDTLQNWSDNGQSALPGFRDRIVEVRTGAGEGGMNIAMSEATILRLAVRGRDAALALTDDVTGFKFRDHREVRYRTAMAELQEAVTNIATKYDGDLFDGMPGYREFVEEALGPGWLERSDTLLTFVGREPGPDGRLDQPRPDLCRERPRPDPDLRIVARF
jgi:predicted acylesterase/phospholipase RssA